MSETEPAALSPGGMIWQLMWPAMATAQAIHVAARLSIADLVADGPKTIDELAAASKAHAPSLRRVLRALASVGVFAEQADGRIANTPISETLRRDHPEAVRAWAVMLGSPFVWRPWGELCHAALHGQPGFEAIYGQPFFQYLGGHPDDAAVFNDAMTAGSSVGATALVAAYDFSSCRRVVDVGGGQGALLTAILAAHPHVRGVLYDLPSVVAAAPAPPAAVSARCERLGGDMFASAPADADTYVLKHVIHDWSDEDALTILRNCRRAIRADGRLLLIEGVLKSANEPDLAKFLDLMMLVLVRGRERTEAEFRELLRQAGFALTRVVPTGGPHAILESRPV